MRLVAIILLFVITSALGVVHLQYQSRKLVTAQEHEQARTRALDVEWTQLTLENSTWAAPGRVEKIAREKLAMITPGKDALVALEGGNAQ